MTTGAVIVVGAGPTGLLLAGDLAAQGIPTTLVERHARGSALSRAFAVHARTLEQLEMRGLAADVVARGQPVRQAQVLGAVRVDLSTMPSRFPFVLIVPQYETEAVLEERARQVGVRIVRAAELTELSQDGAGVTARLSTDETLEASFLVGADGHASTVRRLVGQRFPGRTVIKSVLLADVRLTDPPDGAAVRAVGGRFTFIAPFGDGYHRVIAWDTDQQWQDEFAPVDLGEVRVIMRAVFGTDFGMRDPRWSSRFHSDERQVPQYRVGRVFLAGDAAHEHSPAGGQGMNLGMQDSANLSWKLAQQLVGGRDLLDTYHTERRPVGSAVIRGTGRLLRLAQLTGPARLARDATAFAALRIPALAHAGQRALAGLWVRYPAPPGEHHLVGTRAP
ncbi:MAG: FAD-dependent oxidoreductase, partial [Mycobacteriaceae bacterium]|nr:FAD-dependent oxidoreductase [Mycobacteriaceae bacterium]